MLIDTHCHIDYFDDPVMIAKNYEANNLSCVMVSMLPSQYQMALPHLKSFSSIHPALGVHPLRAKEGRDEIHKFLDLVEQVEFVGEIGLDHSSEGKASKAIQEDVLDKILPSIGAGKFVSVHSRDAHKPLAEMLIKHSVGPVCFHYFIGGIDAALQLASAGHFFSVNLRMLKGRHRALLDHVSKEQILVESDGPYLTKRPVRAVQEVYALLGDVWGMREHAVVKLLADNFLRCRTAKD